LKRLYRCIVRWVRQASSFLWRQYRFGFEKALYSLGWPVVGLYTLLMLRMDVLRLGPLPKGPKILAANHPSTTDPFLVMRLVSEQVSILINEVLFNIPLFGPYLRWAGHVPVPVVAGTGGASFERARQLLLGGRTVAIFPEGAISPLDGGFLQPHTGVARLALSTGVPVIPVGIHLQRERIRLITSRIKGQPEVGTWYFRGRYAMTVGEPLHLTGDVEDHAHVHTAAEKVMQCIIQLAQESAQRMQAARRSRRSQDVVAMESTESAGI
jgi:1-acyl-sn-glycerol-3-phosphate acyltransferase